MRGVLSPLRASRAMSCSLSTQKSCSPERETNLDPTAVKSLLKSVLYLSEPIQGEANVAKLRGLCLEKNSGRE